MTWTRVKTPTFLAEFAKNAQAWQRNVIDGHLSVFAGEEDEVWHMSISHRTNDTLKPGRYPSWDEIHDARDRFCPLDKTMVMYLPPQTEYVNIHKTTFHLWELKD